MLPDTWTQKMQFTKDLQVIHFWRRQTSKNLFWCHAKCLSAAFHMQTHKLTERERSGVSKSKVNLFWTRQAAEHLSHLWRMWNVFIWSKMMELNAFSAKLTYKKRFAQLGFEKGNMKKTTGSGSVLLDGITCLSPPHYLGEYALRRTLREGAAGVEWGGGGGGAGDCFDSPSTPQPHNRLLPQRSREGRMHRQEWERGARRMEVKNKWRPQHETREERREETNNKCRKRKRQEETILSFEVKESVNLNEGTGM